MRSPWRPPTANATSAPSYQVEVTVTLSDVNEGPEISGLQSLSFAENQATDRILATYTATDPGGSERRHLAVESVGF